MHKNIVIFGGSGSLGSAIAKEYREEDTYVVHTPSRKEVNLRDGDAIERYFAKVGEIDTIINCAGIVHGITGQNFNEMFWENSFMWNMACSCSNDHGVRQYINISSSVMYPTIDNILKEELLFLWEDPAFNYSYEKYAMANLKALKKCEYLNRGNTKNLTLILPNLYDMTCDLNKNHMPVIPDVIKKFMQHDANGPVELMGTGKALREFMHVDGAASYLKMIIEHGNLKHTVYNVASPIIERISDLVQQISYGFDDMEYEFIGTDKKDGPAFRKMSGERLAKELPVFQPKHDIYRDITTIIEKVRG